MKPLSLYSAIASASVVVTATATAIHLPDSAPLHIRDTQFKPTPWTTCPDFPRLECRNVTVPRFYEPTTVVQGLANGTLTNLERRAISGSHKKHVWLLQGGPSVTADSLALNIPQIAAALGTDFIIQLPYQRGSPKTETIRDYPAYPAYLNEYLSNQTIPVQAFNTVNAARDIIASVKAEKARDPLVDHYVIALSYGSDLLNEILLSEPALFKTAIFDGISPAIGEAQSVWRMQTLGLSSLAEAIAEDCAQSSQCRSSSLNKLIAFVDGLSLNRSTPCFDLFTEQLALGDQKDQIFHRIAQDLVFRPNLPLPTAIFRNETVDLEKLREKVIAWEGGSRNETDLISLDNRALLWALTNHFTQCNSASINSFQELLVQVFRPILMFYQEEYPKILEQFTETNMIVRDHIIFLEADDPQWTEDKEKAAQAHTLIQDTDLENQFTDTTRTAHAPFLNKADVPMSAADDVQGDLVLLNGILDPNTPIDIARSFYHDIQVADGYRKDLYTYKNAGHIVSFGAWDSCSALLLKAFLGGDEMDKQRFLACLEEENAKSLDWAMSEVQEQTTIDIWEGLVGT